MQIIKYSKYFKDHEDAYDEDLCIISKHKALAILWRHKDKEMKKIERSLSCKMKWVTMFKIMEGKNKFLTKR